jgi:hypothetical protein
MDEDAPLLNGRREPKAPMPMKGRVIPDPPPRPPIPEIQLTRDMPQSDPTKDFAEFAESLTGNDTGMTYMRFANR